MQLSNSQRQQLYAAILDAFPDRATLARVVDFALDVNLNAIAGGDNLGNVTYQLIVWTESQGRIKDLITKAHDESPQNMPLGACLQFLQQLSAEPAPTNPAAPG